MKLGVSAVAPSSCKTASCLREGGVFIEDLLMSQMGENILLPHVDDFSHPLVWASLTPSFAFAQGSI